MLFAKNCSHAREILHLETFATQVQGIFYSTKIQSNSFTPDNFLNLFLVYIF